MSSAVNSTSINHDRLSITEDATTRDSVGVERPSKRSRHSPPSSSMLSTRSPEAAKVVASSPHLPALHRSPHVYDLCALFRQSLTTTQTIYTAIHPSEEEEYVKVHVEDQELDLTSSSSPRVQASAREQDHAVTSPTTRTTESTIQDQSRVLNLTSVNAKCACSARIEEPSPIPKTFPEISNLQSLPLPVRSQQSQDQPRVDPSSLEQTLANHSPCSSPQNNPSLPLTQANLSLLGDSESSSSVFSAESSSDVVSAEASEAGSQGGTDQQSEQSQSTQEMGTVMQMRFLLERNRHFINHRFTDDPDGEERCHTFKDEAFRIINDKRVSDWSPEQALEVQDVIYAYQNEPEATFLFFVWQTLLIKSRRTYQRPCEERTADMEHWMEQTWTKDHLRYKFDIDFARDSLPPLIPANDYERKLLTNTPRVANPKPDIAFAVYKDAFNPTERELFDQAGCNLTGNGSYHEFAALDAKSINASIEEAENQCMRSGSAMVIGRRKLDALYARCPQPAKPSAPYQPANRPLSTQPSSLPPSLTGSKPKIKFDTMVFTLAFATSEARLFINWDLNRNGTTQYHMHNLRNYNYNNLSDLTQLHHDIDNIMDWGVGKRKEKIQKQTARIIQNMVVPLVAKSSPKKRKLEEAGSA